MLVLSRRLDEKILLPTVPAIIKVISSQAGLVRLGIEAPSHVPILREELCRGDRTGVTRPAVPSPGDGPAPNLVARNRLNNLLLGLTLLRMQLVECDPVIRKTLDGLEEEVQALRRAVSQSDAQGEAASPEAALAVNTPA
jgi:carbon storage regulator CsrA